MMKADREKAKPKPEPLPLPWPCHGGEVMAQRGMRFIALAACDIIAYNLASKAGFVNFMSLNNNATNGSSIQYMRRYLLNFCCQSER